MGNNERTFVSLIEQSVYKRHNVNIEIVVLAEISQIPFIVQRSEMRASRVLTPVANQELTLSWKRALNSGIPATTKLESCSIDYTEYVLVSDIRMTV